MWQVERDLRENQEKTEAVEAKLDEAQRTMGVDDREKQAEAAQLRSELAKLKEEKAAILARDKKISDGLPQHEMQRQQYLRHRLQRGR